ncbi:hypothetical protein KIN20_037438, partial [Parelaphostrongylus tenuis]
MLCGGDSVTEGPTHLDTEEFIPLINHYFHTAVQKKYNSITGYRSLINKRLRGYEMIPKGYDQRVKQDEDNGNGLKIDFNQCTCGGDGFTGSVELSGALAIPATFNHLHASLTLREDCKTSVGGATMDLYSKWGRFVGGYSRLARLHHWRIDEIEPNELTNGFPRSKILVPLPSTDDVFDSELKTTSSHKVVNQIGGSENAADGIRKGPGGAVPAQHQRPLTKAKSESVSRIDDADSDCLQRFLKIKVKQVTESDGTVSGTLLVTPNCLMFDPDVSHPLVRENGQDLYGMVANMDEIVSVSVYKDISALTGNQSEKKKDIFDPDHVASWGRIRHVAGDVPADPEPEPEPQANSDDPIQKSIACEGLDLEASSLRKMEDKKAGEEHPSEVSSETYLPSINEETNSKSPDDDRPTDMGGDDTREEFAQVHLRQGSSSSQTLSSQRSSEERSRSYSELDAAQNQTSGFESRFSPSVARRSFGKLGRTLSARAKSIHGTVAQGTKQVAHGVVTHTKSAADSLQTGLGTGVKVMGEAANAAANQAKAAADVVASVPGRVVDVGTSLVSDGINGVQEMFNIDVE